MSKKTLKELTLKDNFLFGAVMSDEENCRRFLEMVLQMPIEKVEVCQEKYIHYHPEYKGIRLDVYAKDEKQTHYNVEMQAVQSSVLEKRTRYYHSQIDMELLLRGADYEELPNSYVIFVCDFDPFGEGRYCYTFEERCVETTNLFLKTGSKSIFLSTHGKNDTEVPKEMVKFLNYVKADLVESIQDFNDDFVKQLQGSVQFIKESGEWEERFMVLHEMLRDERAEGKAEGKAEAVLELLEELGTIPENLREKIIKETDMVILKQWHKLAAKTISIEQFLKDM
ncbi:MAG: Rpn family recombination-promoting nuclease/putative transposase [Lachnospiraceae bacterium]|nr:Rpn family recombination-promoting nuclease/putative transposase [Lachnospiraceae bacterium]